MKSLAQNRFGVSSIAVVVAIAAFICISAPHSAHASAVFFKKTDVTVQVGDVFPLTLNLDPQSVAQYTAIVSLKFPADLLVADSFSFNSGWLSIPQPGYDLIDNAVGKIIKTAGYANGFNFPSQLGTVMFKAKHAGTGYITYEPDSQMLNENGDNTINSRGQFTVTVVDKPVPKETAPVKVATTTPPPPPEPTTTPPVTEFPTTSPPVIPQSDINNWMYNMIAIIVGLVIVSAITGLLLGWAFFGKKRGRKNSRSRIGE